MLVDAGRDRPIEVEVIIGEVVRMAKEFNIDIPVAKKIPHFNSMFHADRLPDYIAN